MPTLDGKWKTFVKKMYEKMKNYVRFDEGF